MIFECAYLKGRVISMESGIAKIKGNGGEELTALAQADSQGAGKVEIGCRVVFLWQPSDAKVFKDNRGEL